MSRRLSPLLLIGLASCTAGPDYHVPDSALVKSPLANGALLNAGNAAVSQDPLPAKWWHLYDDPRLDGYIEEALKANTDLRAAEAHLAGAKFAIREVAAEKTVHTGVGGGAQYTHQGGIDELEFPDASYSLGFQISYPLDLAGGIRRAVASAQANAEAVEAARDAVRVTVAAAIARNYVGVCSANRSIAASRHVVAVQSSTYTAIQRLFKNGRDTAFDVTRARAAVQQSTASIPPLVARRQAALYAMAALMGRPAASYPRELETCATPPTLHQPLPGGDGAALLRRRADIRSAERTLAAATAIIGVETAKMYPQVNLGAAVGIAGPFNVFNSHAWGGNVGPLVSWSWPNRMATRARIAEAGASADAAAAKFDGSVLTALQQTESALDTYVHDIERVQELSEARDSTEMASEQADRLFRFGRATFIDVLQAQASLANAESTLAAAQATLTDDQINVFLALGGGWEN